MNTSGWRWVGSVPSMQGEISHWWPLTDGGLTARCNTDPREYQVSPHYTLHRLFQLPMLPPLIGKHAQNNVETLLLKNIKSSLFDFIFCRALPFGWECFHRSFFHQFSLIIFYSLVLSTVSLEKNRAFITPTFPWPYEKQLCFIFTGLRCIHNQFEGLAFSAVKLVAFSTKNSGWNCLI